MNIIRKYFIISWLIKKIQEITPKIETNEVKRNENLSYFGIKKDKINLLNSSD